jgi:hypothetical protein
MLTNLYYTIFILYFLLLLTRIAGFRVIEIITCSCAFSANLAGLMYLYYSSSNLPVFNIFESFLLVSFILGLTALFLLFKGDFSSKIRLTVWIEIIFLFLIMHFSPKETSVRVYDHGYVYIVMFHAFRYIALALMLFATAWFIQFIIQREMDERTSMLAHYGRNYLLLAAVFYLMGEYIGIIWCQKGWGDFWMWSKTFLQSTFVVLYLMLAFHIPGKGRKAEDIRCVIGGLSGLFFLTLTIMRSMF